MSADRMLKNLQRRAWMRWAVDFAAIFAAFIAGYSPTGSQLVGAGAAAAVAAYGYWCFRDGAQTPQP